MKFFSEEVLVLSKKFVNENDILVCFMSKNRGVFWAVAKNGRKSRRRFVNSFEQPALLYGYFRGDIRSGRKVIVEKVSIIECFPNIKSDFLKIISAWYVLELGRRLSPTGDSFDLILESIYEIEENRGNIFDILFDYTKKIFVKEGFAEEKDFDNRTKELLKDKITAVFGFEPKFLFILDKIEEFQPISSSDILF